RASTGDASPRLHVVAAPAPRLRSVPRDALRPPVHAEQAPPRPQPSGPTSPSRRLLLLLGGLAAAAAAVAVRVAQRAAPIIDPDEVLPDNTHLLRQLDAPHRPRRH